MGNNRSRHSSYSQRSMSGHDIFLRSVRNGDITMATLLSTTKGRSVCLSVCLSVRPSYSQRSMSGHDIFLRSVRNGDITMATLLSTTKGTATGILSCPTSFLTELYIFIYQIVSKYLFEPTCAHARWAHMHRFASV